jgi:hypothetical protein
MSELPGQSGQALPTFKRPVRAKTGPSARRSLPPPSGVDRMAMPLGAYPDSANVFHHASHGDYARRTVARFAERPLFGLAGCEIRNTSRMCPARDSQKSSA